MCHIFFIIGVVNGHALGVVKWNKHNHHPSLWIMVNEEKDFIKRKMSNCDFIFAIIKQLQPTCITKIALVA